MILSVPAQSICCNRVSNLRIWRAACLVILMLTGTLLAWPGVQAKPGTTPGATQPLSLHDAILLAMRDNANVRSAHLQRVVDRYARALAHNEFAPQWRLTAQTQIQDGGAPHTQVSPAVTLKTRLGTQLSVAAEQQWQSGADQRSVALKVAQPLLRGFGSQVNRLNLEDAEDAEYLAQLALQAKLMDVVAQVETVYWQWALDQGVLRVQTAALAQSRKSLARTRMQVKLGRAPAAHQMQQQTQVMGQVLAVSDARSSIKTDLYQLRDLLRLRQDTLIRPRQASALIQRRLAKLPTAEQAVQQALAHNIDYQRQRINHQRLQRTLQRAKDQQRWQLEAEGQVQWQVQAEAQHTTHKTAGLRLAVPVHDVARHKALVDARIALRQADLQLAAAQDALVAQVQNAVRRIRGAERKIKLAKQQLHYARQAYQSAEVGYQHGVLSAFQLNLEQQRQVDAEQSIETRTIGYMNQWVALQKLLGTTLTEWGIQAHLYPENGSGG